MKRGVFAVSMALAAGLPLAGLAVEYFADAVNGSDSYDGTAAKWAGGESTVGPKKTIQEAVKLADGNGTIITLLPGVYDEGGDENTGSYIQSNRVVITKNKVTLRSSTGKAKDVHVVGRKSTAAGNDHGIGEGAMRCLAVNQRVTGAVAVGITFRDGASKDATTIRGGGIYGANGLTIIDCVVSNCAAYRGGGGQALVAHSSLFTGNYAAAYGAALNQSSMANCLVVHNGTDSKRSPITFNTVAVNCTVARNGNESAVFQNTAATAGNGIYNMLIFGHRDGNNVYTSTDVYASVIEGEGTTDGKSHDANTILDAVAAEECAAPVLDDWRPLSTGHCANRGVGAYLGLVPIPEGYTYHDMAGNEIDTNSTVTVGAYQEVVVPAAARLVLASSFYEVDGARYPSWSTGEWITPLAWPVAYRVRWSAGNTFGFYINEEYAPNGEDRNFLHAQYDGWTVVVPWRDATATNTLVRQSYSKVFYVDRHNGSDLYNGTAAEPEGGDSLVGPKKTLQAAADANAEASGNYGIVYVAPGIYDEGGSFYNSLSNRVQDCGTAVGFIASGGPGTATIVGAPDPETKGLGANAMRGVCLRYKYSFLQGFNVTGGYTSNATGTESDDAICYGGGAWLGSALTQLLDCNVTSNNAGICGGVFRGTLIRCRIMGNTAIDRAAAVRGANLYGCIVDGNIGLNRHVEMFSRIDSCIIGPNAKRANGVNAANALYNCTGAIVNSLVLIPVISETGNLICATNCIFNANSNIANIPAERIVDCIVTNLSAVAYDENCRPIVGANVGIDRADDTLSNLSFLGSTDLSGTQAVMNGVRDLGALEADWRPRYAADLGGRCTVATVSPEVCENAAGHVYLPSGSLAGTFAATSKPVRRLLGVRVTGTGVLTVTVAGEVVGEFTASENVQSMMLTLSAAGDAFAFDYAPGNGDTGGAEIVECVRLAGTAISIR